MKSHYREFFNLGGKTAIVTGAVGILGSRFCRGLAEFGAKVVVVDLDQERCSAFAAELEKDMKRPPSVSPATSLSPSRLPQWSIGSLIASEPSMFCITMRLPNPLTSMPSSPAQKTIRSPSGARSCRLMLMACSSSRRLLADKC